MSLPQGLTEDQKKERVAKWRQENPQPKKEEQPKEVEDKSDLPIGAAGPAGEPPKKEEPKEEEVEADENEDVEESPGADATKEKVEKPAYDMNSASYNSFMQKEKAKEIQDELENVDASTAKGEYTTPKGQKLGEIITDGSGWEYKMEANPDNPSQPLFYTRKVGDTDWINASNHGNKEGDDLAKSQVAEASIANLFGLSEFGDEQRQEYFQNVENVKELKRKQLEDRKKAKEKKLEYGNDFMDSFSQDTVTEGVAMGTGELVEKVLRTKVDAFTNVIAEPMAAVLDFFGVIDAEELGIDDEDSLTGIKLNDVLDQVVTDYALTDPNDLAAGESIYDWEEEVGDKIESGVLNIAAGMNVVPKWLADNKKLIGQSINDNFNIPPVIKSGLAVLENPHIRKYFDATIGMATGLGNLNALTREDVVAAGEKSYEELNEKIDVLNNSLAQFDGYATDEFGNAYDFVKAGDTKNALAALVTGGSRLTADAIGSLPSVAQSMIPYVGIASIVIGEAAKANKESDLEGRELDWNRMFHANVIGASEGLLEYTTKKIGGKMFRSLSGKGLPKQAINKTLTQWGVSIMKDFGAEGLSESATLLINSVADQIYKGDDRNNDGVIDANERARKGMFGSKYLPEFGELMDTFIIGGLMGGGMGTVTAGGSLIRNTIAYKNIKTNLDKTGISNLSSIFSNKDPLGDFDKNSTLPKQEDEVLPEDITEKEAVEYLNLKNKQRTTKAKEQGFVGEGARLNTAEAIAEAKTELANKKNSETAQDIQADGIIDLATDPNTERFLETDLQRQVKSGDMSTTRADEIRSNFRSQQQAALVVKSQGITGTKGVEAMNLLQEKQAIQENIKKTDDAFTTQDKQRLDEINSRLGEIKVESMTDSTAEAIMKGDERGQAIAEQMGIGYTAGDQSTVDNKIKELQDKGGDIDTKNSTEYGTFVTMPDGSKEIIINNDIAMEDRVVTTAQHEVLHGVLKTTFDNNPEVVIEMGKSLLAELQNNPGITLSQDFLDRIAQYETDLANGVIDEATFFEEVMTLTSEGLTDKTIQMNETALMKLGDIIRRALSAIGINVTFKSGNDVLNFIRDYNKSFEKGKLDRGQRKELEKVSKKQKYLKRLQVENLLKLKVI